MAETKDRRKAPRKNNAATPAPDTAADKQARAVPGELPEEEMRRQIAEAAYYRAKQRGFAPGYELEDWVQAESEVRNRLENNP